MSFPELLFVLMVAGATVTVFLMGTRRHPAPKTQIDTARDPVALLFEDGVLYHATHTALHEFSFFPGANVWDDLRDALLPRFPDFPMQINGKKSGTKTLFAKDPKDTNKIEVHWRDGMCWVELKPSAAREQTPHPSSVIVQMCCDTMTQPAWQTLENGQIGWRNVAYEKLRDRIGFSGQTQLFDLSIPNSDDMISIALPDGKQKWFEVSTHRSKAMTLHHANQVTDLVKTRQAQGTFVQALAKTFAHLSIGLAIFDKEGRLNIFNPAMVDLSGLPPAFLATQPTMLSFFDALRENRRMPEPKNYGNWRQDILDMIAAASDDDYRETWTLEDGRTYTVQGRPHPDGATAFLIEDISSEVTLNRNFRIEVEQYEALLDHIDSALAVFSSTGVLTFCNATYRDLWAHNPETAFADVTISDAIAVWRGIALPGAAWDRVETQVTTFGRRDPGEISVVLKNGVRLVCQAIPIGSDATMIRFDESKAAAGRPLETVQTE